MKPSFALTLSHESIGLMHRTPQGWVSIGTVATDDPDLTGALDYLRRTALGLEPQGFATKVVIPNTEILYDVLRAPGPKPAQRRAQIAAALEGRTPYTLDELTFDWSGTGDEVHVAIVARETLAEAEAFATEHGFNPVSFVAIPAPGGFAAEPWFGQTSCAPDLLAPGEKVVRDQDPIRPVQRAPAKAA
ncbi:MAG: translation initiation factor 2, partial [Gemmobacter sp.]|nr:translation initiation factor 2 [Gemmobacter sp.]